MYLAANLRVWILDSLSDGNVGMILRRAENASLRLWVRWRSRTLAKTRCDWTSWCCRWLSGMGEALLPPELDPWSIWLLTDERCRWWWILLCLLLLLLFGNKESTSLCCCWLCCCWWWWLWTLLSPLWSEPPESESREFSDRRFRLFCWWLWWWWLCSMWLGGDMLFSCWRWWWTWLSLYSRWSVLNNTKSVSNAIRHNWEYFKKLVD